MDEARALRRKNRALKAQANTGVAIASSQGNSILSTHSEDQTKQEAPPPSGQNNKISSADEDINKPPHIGAPAVAVVVYCVDGEQLRLSIWEPSTIVDVKIRIQKKLGVQPGNADLFTAASDVPLGDDVTMVECGFSADGGAAATDEGAAAAGEGEGEGSANALFLIVNSSFIAAASFAGAKQGYVFTTGPQGLGYYQMDEDLGIACSHTEYDARLKKLKKSRGY